MAQSSHRTSLQEIRDFLDRHGTAPPAWSDARSPLDALYRLLEEHRDDPAFWSELDGLTRRLDDARFRTDHLDGRDAIDGARLDGLMTDLRASLPANGHRGGTARAWVGSGIGASAVAAFVLLGTSLGCPTDLCPEATDAGIAADDQTVYCDLVDIIDTATIDDSAKDDLLACLPEMSPEEREDLLDQFENADDDELADVLMDLAASSDCSGASDDDTTDPWDDDDH